MKKTKRNTLAAVAVIAAVAVAFCAVQYVFRAGDLPRHVRRLIAKYETAPDIETADKLAGILTEGGVSDKVGSRVLKALMQPTLHTRESYPVGSRPIFAVSFPNRIRFSPAEFTWQAVLFDDNNPSGKYRKEGYKPFGLAPANGLHRRYEMMSRPYPLGRHDLDLRIECSIRPRKWKTTWRRPSLRNFPHGLMPRKNTRLLPGFQNRRYQCTLELPVQLNIVPPGSETKVRIVSSEELDGKMKAAFTSILDPAHKTSGHFGDENRIVTSSATGSIKVFYSSLPEHYAFEAIYRDGITGVEYTVASSSCGVIFKGDSGKFTVFPANARLPKPGTYTGMIIFTPDLSRISHYPEIPQIWGGRLQFPITFQWKNTIDVGGKIAKTYALIRKTADPTDFAGVAFLVSKLADRRVYRPSSKGDDFLVCDEAAQQLQKVLKIDLPLMPRYLGTRKERDEGIEAWKEWWDANKDVSPDEWQRGE